jgi:hypothetical protein
MALGTNLIGYWKQNESSGNAADSSASGLTLTNTAVTFGSGKLGNAGTYDGSTAFLEAAADTDATLLGDVDFTIAAWIKGHASLAAFAFAAGRWNFPSPRHYRIGVDNVKRPAFAVTHDGSTEKAAVGHATINLSTDTDWHLIIGWHDSVGNAVYCQFDNATPVSNAHSTGVYNSGTNRFRVGSRNGGDFWQGSIDDVYLWSRVLTSDERTELWNSGNGVADILAAAGRNKVNSTKLKSMKLMGKVA